MISRQNGNGLQRNGRESLSGESSATSESGEREDYSGAIPEVVIDPVEDREVEDGIHILFLVWLLVSCGYENY